MPSYTELMALFGYRSRNAAAYLVERIVAAGFAERDALGRLIPPARSLPLPLYGEVSAGYPVDVEAQPAEMVSIDEYLGDDKDSFLLRVDGDSMIEAGILPGDIVIVEPKRQARVGEIVLAQVDNQWTLKFLDRVGSRMQLKPGNPRYQPIAPREELRLGGVIRGVFRRYR
ncbi:LexA family transcriptional regulator [Candidatus Parcubacteria bacterium]|nr:LexA family transcriptional regulator [Candidatus Parcubacteria bacterium]MBI4099144.1 LexA family transcriptional regulator [Candidatus Parcubacteria bacterium]MBI4385382.1 LexA family transcriptional regulator [Candidatus Parcubacteria bacterium]